MYKVKRVRLFNFIALKKISNVLHSCGKDMYQKHGLKHWDNSRFKNAIIVLMCSLRNDLYLVLDDNGNQIATFQTKKSNVNMRFMKLATLPEYAGNGVGTFCLSYIEKLASESNCEYICCEVYDQSRHAIEFYKKRGFELCGEITTLKYKELKMRKRCEVSEP